MKIEDLSDEQIKNLLEKKRKDKKTVADEKTVSGTKEETDILNKILGGVQTFLQVPTFGFMDEASGAINAPVYYAMDKLQGRDTSLSDAYKRGRDEVRQQVNQFAQEQPITSIGLQTAGTGPLLSRKAIEFITKNVSPSVRKFAAKNPFISSMLAGAGTGAVTGYGISEADNPYDLAKDVGSSTVLGAGISPAMLALGTAGRVLTKPITSRFFTPAKESAEEEFVKTLTQSGKKMSDADMPFEDSLLGLSLGENVKGKFDLMAAMPGQTKDKVKVELFKDRQNKMQNLLEPIRREAGASESVPFDQILAEKYAQRKQIVDPLYNELRKFNFDVNKSPKLENVLTRAQDYLRPAAKLARIDGREFTLSPDNAAFDLVNAGEIDTLKRTLDIAIEKAYKSGSRSEANSLVGLKNDLVSVVDDLTTMGDQSAYQKARKAYQKESAYITQAEKGREFFKSNTIDSTDTKLYFDSLNPEEKDAFRLGAYESIKRRLGTRGGKRNIMDARDAGAGGQEEVADKLRVLFKTDKSWKDFVKRTEFEYTQTTELSRLGEGTKTMPRESFAEDMADQSRDIVQGVSLAGLGLKTGDPMTAIASVPLLKKASTRTFTPSAVRDELGNIMLAKKKDFGRLGLDNIEKRVLDRQEQDRINRILQSQRFNLLNNPFTQSVGFGLFD